MNELIRIDELSWRVGDQTILDLQDLTIHQGERIALIGGNGAGKSTLIQALFGLIEVDRARIGFSGLSRGGELERKREIAVVFQDANLLKGTVLFNAGLGLRIRGLSKKECVRQAMTWLTRFGIGHLAERDVRRLSGGEAKRVALARALATRPKLLLLDEPFSALDLPTRSALLSDLSRILRDMGTALLFVTHHPAEIPLMAQRILVMDQGRIIQDDTPQTLFEQPGHIAVARLLGYENILSAAVHGGRVLLPGGQTLHARGTDDMPDGTSVTLCIKAEDIQPQADDDANFNRMPFRVDRIMPLHDSFRLSSEWHGGLALSLNRRQYQALRPQEGMELAVSVPPEAVVIIPGHSAS